MNLDSWTSRAFGLALVGLLVVGCRRTSGIVEAIPPGDAGDAAWSVPPVGVNLELVSDFSRSLMFADAMRSARHWGSVNAPWDEAASVDADGWPTGDAGVVVLVEIPDARALLEERALLGVRLTDEENQGDRG